MNEPDELELRWPRVVGRVVLYGMLAVGLYFASIGPLYYFFGYRWLGVDRALWHFCAPLRWTSAHTGAKAGFAAYYRWWSELPGGADQRIRDNPEYMWRAIDTMRRDGLLPNPQSLPTGGPQGAPDPAKVPPGAPEARPD